MKRKPSFLLFVVIASLAIFTGCGEEEGPTISTQEDQTITVTQDFGLIAQDVYFVFTNANRSASYGKFKAQPVSQSTAASQSIQPSPSSGSVSLRSSYVSKAKPILKDRPDLIGLRTDFAAFPKSETRESLSLIPPRPLYAAIDSTYDFLDGKVNSSGVVTQQTNIRATLKKSYTVNSLTLNVWVASDAWGEGCARVRCMDQKMVDGFAKKFLNQEVAGDDIYHWVSNLYGAPWGVPGYTDLIDETAKSQIDILFYDIEDDNSIDGGVLGFFWPKDNFKRTGSSSESLSNERLMFYMDSVLAATYPDSTWDVTDQWPEILVGTLAHEFQHMIHFYQKGVLRAGTHSEVWLNEMCSEMAEDLVAEKLNINGPRGVPFNIGHAGSQNNQEGRIPAYNSYHHGSLTDWKGDGISYSTAYAFGAYLARNYGGAELFKKIVQNSHVNEQAVITALNEQGYSLSFKELMQSWGAAVVMSDLNSAPLGQVYNTGTWITDNAINTIDYRLGSINFYNYLPSIESGFWDLQSYFYTATSYETANIIALTATNIVGVKSWEVTMPAGVSLKVVTKNSSP